MGSPPPPPAAALALLPDKLTMQLICPVLYISNDQTHSRIFIPLTSFLFSQGHEKTKKCIDPRRGNWADAHVLSKSLSSQFISAPLPGQVNTTENRAHTVLGAKNLPKET